MIYVLALMIASAHMIVPVARFDDEQKCRAVINALDASALEVNKSIAFGCVSEDKLNALPSDKKAP